MMHDVVNKIYEQLDVIAITRNDNAVLLRDFMIMS